MLDWRTILCGVDGSEESIRAAKLGAMIAKGLSARPLGVYVIPSHPVFQLGIHRAQGEAELAADAQVLLNRLQEETGLAVEPLILEGDPAASILEVAAEHACDLIVVGRRGLGKVERWLLGNVATKVVLHTPCAVLVSKDIGPVPDSPFARTLCGLDGSPESERAGMEALGLVSLLGGTIRFAHVTYRVQGAEIEPLVGDYASAGALLAKFCEKARQAGVVADSVELSGQPAAALLEHAAAWEASLIAVGSRGLGGFAGLRLGSTSHQIARHSTCSVLISPRRQEC
jgi:nucleotide-binding universal stress UspA family protein